MVDKRIISVLKSLEPALKAQGVASLHLFGSHGKGSATARSDIDIFVDPANADRFSFRNFIGAYHILEDAFPDSEIGYGTRDGLSPHIRPVVEREAIKIF